MTGYGTKMKQRGFCFQEAYILSNRGDRHSSLQNRKEGTEDCTRQGGDTGEKVSKSEQ